MGMDEGVSLLRCRKRIQQPINMNHMKKYIFFFLLIFLIGCKSPKPLVSTSSEIQTVEQTQKDIASSTKETQMETANHSEVQTIVGNETTTMIRTDYDTDKPVDPVTGKHPVKTEIKTETIKRSKQDVKAESQQDKTNQFESLTTDKSKIDTNQDKTEVKKEDSPKDPYRYRYIFYILLILLMLIGGFFLFRKKTSLLF